MRLFPTVPLPNLPPLNALPLGNDLTASRNPELWRPDPALTAMAPSFHDAPPFRAPPHAATSLAAGTFGNDRSGVKKNGMLRASGDHPPLPDDRGVIDKEIDRWRKEGDVSPYNAALTGRLLKRVREALWVALHADPSSDIARKIDAKGIVYVRIVPHDGTLEKYDLALYGSPPPAHDYRQAQWTLDLETGTLHPVDLVSHNVVLLRSGLSGAEQKGFVPFYRSVRFASLALKGDSLMIHLSEERRTALRTPPAPPPKPAEPTFLEKLKKAMRSEPAKTPSHPTIVGNRTILVRYIQRVRDLAMREVEFYCTFAKPSVTEEGARRLRGLVDLILQGLYRRELNDPEVARYAQLHVWLRDAAGSPENRPIEIYTPDEFLNVRPGPRDILLQLVRDHEALHVPHPYLLHVARSVEQIGGDYVAKGADFDFLVGLGLLPNDKMLLRLDSLRRRPENLNEWDLWMVENGYWRKPIR